MAHDRTVLSALRKMTAAITDWSALVRHFSRNLGGMTAAATPANTTNSSNQPMSGVFREKMLSCV